MKIIVIGDLHGTDCWKIAVNKYADLYIFIGDYVDSYENTDKQILDNFKEIIEFKKKYMNKVILLLGNHDIHYTFYPKYLCSGFRKSMLKDLKKLFTDNKNLFQVAFQIKNYLFTHAGVSNKWFRFFKRTIDLRKFKGKDLDEIFNSVYRSKKRDVLFSVGPYRGGFEIGGILWADGMETSKDIINGYHQIVGHSKVERIGTFCNENSSITYIDCLDSEIKFYELEI